MTGLVRLVTPPSNISNAPVINNTWTILVEPDPAYDYVLTTQTGQKNPTGQITCTVNVDPTVVDTDTLESLLNASINQTVRIIGTWCDDTTNNVTVFCPLSVLLIDNGFEVYTLKGWPVAVHDVSLLAFTHAARPDGDTSDPHSNESQTFTFDVQFPLKPADEALPFWRAYASTRVGQAASVGFSPVDEAPRNWLRVSIETGLAANRQGFYAVQLGLTYDEPKLDDYCPPGHCDEDDGTYCVHTGSFRYTRRQPFVSTARKGDLALSPSDGKGTIGTILTNLTPPQVYDHMGIFVDDGQTIRHCTSSKGRYEQEELFTTSISVDVPGFGTFSQRLPLNGIRPDLLRYGWPGSITQTVGEVYQSGWNTLNPRWQYATTHPGQDLADPENPGHPFALYHLPRADRQARLAFNDPEIDWHEPLPRLQEGHETIDGTVFEPRLVRPFPEFDARVRPALEAIADAALKIDAHYRLFGYSQGSISLDPAFAAPPIDSPAWGGLPSGASWPANSTPAVCSTFIWAAVQEANKVLPAASQILLEDRADPADPAIGLEYGSHNGLYQYHEDERLKAAKGLAEKLTHEISAAFAKKLPPAIGIIPLVRDFKDQLVERLVNQMANAFAFDYCEKLDAGWLAPGEGESAGPDDILHFWDPRHRRQTEQGLAVYGDSEPLMVKAATWLRIPLFKKQLIDPGKGTVVFRVFEGGHRKAGAVVRFDDGCKVVTTQGDGHNELVNSVILPAGTHFADAYMVLTNPITGNEETFRTKQTLKFEVINGGTVSIDLELVPPPDLWRILDVDLHADIHDRSFWGGDADHNDFRSSGWTLSLQQDLDDSPYAPAGQVNTVLYVEKTFSSPEVGSGVHVIVLVKATLNPADRSIACHCEVSLIDTSDGGIPILGPIVGINPYYTVDQREIIDVVIPADDSKDVLINKDFGSDEAVPERATVSLRLTNRHRPS